MTWMKTLCMICIAALLFTGAAAYAQEEFGVAQITIESASVPDNEALAFTQNMKVGWNLGNTFDAVDCAWLTDKLNYETAWVGDKTTPELFQTLKDAGFASVRIPVSWHNHVNEDFIIDADWLARVKEVAGYALELGFYVIINTHHDIDQAYIYPDTEHLDTSLRYLTAIWMQVADEFQDVGEQLIFESMNEPRLKGTDIEWWLNPNDERSAEAVDCINQLNQAFVDTIRAAGGENASRYLLVPGYSASLDGAMHKKFSLPSDSVDNRIIVSVHAYTPYSFALQASSESGATSAFNPDRQRDTSEINKLMSSLHYRFIKEGIPVIIGEYGARIKEDNLRDRADYHAYYIASASARGIPCFVWDNNVTTGSGELFGLLDRGTNTFVFPEIVDSIMTYAD